MLQFVSKNKIIPALLVAIQSTVAGQVKQSALQEALIAQDMQHPIFSDPECYLLAYSLYEHQKISHSEYLTTLLYLMTLQQYTPLQSLKVCDDGLKEQSAVQYHFPTQSEESTFLFKSYLFQFEKRANEIGLAFDIPKLLNAANQFEGVEQGFITVSFSDILTMDPKQSTSDNIARIMQRYQRSSELTKKRIHPYRLMFTLLTVSPLFQIIPSENVFVIPSMSWIKLVLNEMNPNFQLHAMPILGGITPLTLYRQFHSLNLHPIQLYSQHIASNPKTIHSFAVGPLTAALHDLLHIFVASYGLKNGEFDFLIKELIPFVLNFKEYAGMNLSDEKYIINSLDLLFTYLNDIDFVQFGSVLVNGHNKFLSFFNRSLPESLSKNPLFISLLTFTLHHSQRYIAEHYSVDCAPFIQSLLKIMPRTLSEAVQQYLVINKTESYPVDLTAWNGELFAAFRESIEPHLPMPSSAMSTPRVYFR